MCKPIKNLVVERYIEVKCRWLAMLRFVLWLLLFLARASLHKQNSLSAIHMSARRSFQLLHSLQVRTCLCVCVHETCYLAVYDPANTHSLTHTHNSARCGSVSVYSKNFAFSNLVQDILDGFTFALGFDCKIRVSARHPHIT